MQTDRWINRRIDWTDKEVNEVTKEWSKKKQNKQSNKETNNQANKQKRIGTWIDK